MGGHINTSTNRVQPQILCSFPSSTLFRQAMSGLVFYRFAGKYLFLTFATIT
jgi:hypothetical protein